MDAPIDGLFQQYLGTMAIDHLPVPPLRPNAVRKGDWPLMAGSRRG